MASVYYLCDDALNLSEDVVQQYREHGQLQARQNTAATKIQRVYRGYQTRKQIDFWHRSARKIQKVVRGWRVRFRLPEILHETYDEMCEKKFYLAASKIQALWRGIMVRKEICIKRIMEEKAEAQRMNEKLKKMISGQISDDESEREDETEEEKEERWNRQKERLKVKYKPYMERIGNMLIDRHHLLSTKSSKGVFSKKDEQELSSIEKLLRSISWTDYMKKVRKIHNHYSKGNGDQKGIIFVDKRLQKEQKLLDQRDRSRDVKERREFFQNVHRKGFKLDKRVDKKTYERYLSSMEEYKVYETNIVRTIDNTKNISKTDFDLNVFFKDLAKDCKVPQYFIDFWFKACTTHNLD